MVKYYIGNVILRSKRYFIVVRRRMSDEGIVPIPFIMFFVTDKISEFKKFLIDPRKKICFELGQLEKMDEDHLKFDVTFNKAMIFPIICAVEMEMNLCPFLI